MTRLLPHALALLLCASTTAAMATQATTQPAPKAIASPGTATAGQSPATAKAGAAPAAGGNGGGVGSNNSNTATQITPKKPKCPDPTVSCPAEKVISK